MRRAAAWGTNANPERTGNKCLRALFCIRQHLNHWPRFQRMPRDSPDKTWDFSLPTVVVWYFSTAFNCFRDNGLHYYCKVITKSPLLTFCDLFGDFRLGVYFCFYHPLRLGVVTHHCIISTTSSGLYPRVLPATLCSLICDTWRAPLIRAFASAKLTRYISEWLPGASTHFTKGTPGASLGETKTPSNELQGGIVSKESSL